MDTYTLAPPLRNVYRFIEFKSALLGFDLPHIEVPEEPDKYGLVYQFRLLNDQAFCEFMGARCLDQFPALQWESEEPDKFSYPEPTHVVEIQLI